MLTRPTHREPPPRRPWAFASTGGTYGRPDPHGRSDYLARATTWVARMPQDQRLEITMRWVGRCGERSPTPVRPRPAPPADNRPARARPVRCASRAGPNPSPPRRRFRWVSIMLRTGRPRSWEGIPRGFRQPRSRQMLNKISVTLIKEAYVSTMSRGCG